MCFPVVKGKNNRTVPASSSTYTIQSNQSPNTIQSVVSSTTIESIESIPPLDSWIMEIKEGKPCAQLLIFLKSVQAERRNGLTYNGRSRVNKKHIS